MVVINGNAMKDKDHDAEATSASKLKEIHEHEIQNCIISENQNQNDSRNQVDSSLKNNMKSADEEDLYADVDPKNQVNSNGGSGMSPQSMLGLTNNSVEYSVNNTDRLQQETGPREKCSSISDVFGQLVSDTLIDDAVDGVTSMAHSRPNVSGTATPAKQNDCLTAVNSSTPCKTQAVVSPHIDSHITDCSGDEEIVVSSGSGPLQQSEVMFTAAAEHAAVHANNLSNSEQEDEDDVEEEDDEEEDAYDEDDSDSEDFDDEEYRAAVAAQKAKNKIKHQKDGEEKKNNSSIMVIDSEEEEEHGEELDDEQLEEDDEDAEDEEMEHDRNEKFDSLGQSLNSTKNNRSISSPSFLPNNVRGSNNDSCPMPKKSYPLSSKSDDLLGHLYPDASKQMSSEDSKAHQQQRCVGSNVGSENMRSIENQSCRSMGEPVYQNIVRDHSSIMKKVKFNQELISIKRQGIADNMKENSDTNEDVEDEWDEEECWEELKEWNKIKQQEVKQENENQISRKQLPLNKQPAVVQQHSSEKDCSQNINGTEANNSSSKCNKISCEGSGSGSTEGMTPTQETVGAPKATISACLATSAPVTVTPLVAQLNEDKGYFEIGHCAEDDPNLSMYLFSVTIIFAKGLSKVVPGTLMRSCREGPYFSYSLLGCPVHTDSISDISKPQFPAEKANARVLATNSNMKKYLEQLSNLTVVLMIGEIQLAKCTVDLQELRSTSQRKEIEGKKVEGAFELVGVEGNTAAAVKLQQEAIVGLSVELSRLLLPVKSKVKDEQSLAVPSLSTSVTSHAAKENNDFGQHFNKTSEEFASLKNKKRERHDSSNSNASHSRDDSMVLSASRKAIKQELKPPMKKRKLEEFGLDKKIYSPSDQAGEPSAFSWEYAEEDFKKWRQAQENVFWKQWLLREKKLQESLSSEWHSRVAGLEDQLEEERQEVQLERAALEEEWRAVRERELRVRDREEQLLQLQQEVLQQQASLSSQLRLGIRADNDHSVAHRRLAVTHQPSRLSAAPDQAGGSGLSSKDYYKSQWLRGVASTHKKWSADHRSLPVSGRLSSSPPQYSFSGFSRSPNSRTGASTSTFSTTFRTISDVGDGARTLRDRPTASKYNTKIIDEIARLTKERKELLAGQSSEGKRQKVVNLDRTIEKLMDASGV